LRASVGVNTKIWAIKNEGSPQIKSRVSDLRTFAGDALSIGKQRKAVVQPCRRMCINIFK
jgi:hypothetical protein